MQLNFNISNSVLLLIGLYFLIANAIDVGVARGLPDSVSEKATLVRNSSVALVVSIILVIVAGGMILGMIETCNTEVVYSRSF
jgi:hypothetical protein